MCSCALQYGGHGGTHEGWAGGKGEGRWVQYATGVPKCTRFGVTVHAHVVRIILSFIGRRDFKGSSKPEASARHSLRRSARHANTLPLRGLPVTVCTWLRLHRAFHHASSVVDLTASRSSEANANGPKPKASMHCTAGVALHGITMGAVAWS